MKLSPDSVEERFQFIRVEAAISAHAAADVDGKRLDLIDGGADIGGVQTAGQEDRHRRLLDDPAAQTPVVDAAGAAEFFNSQSGVAAVQQQGVGLAGGAERLVDRSFVADMDDLDDLDDGQDEADGGDRSGLGRVDQLQRAGLGAQVVGDDGAGLGLAGQQEGGDRRRYGAGDATDEVVGDRARSAGHGGDQPQGRSPEGNGRLGLFLRSDAADLHPGFHGFSDKI